ncbi:phospholipase D-like domain-containing protein [Pseudomonas coronafaciens]|uniref:phospholipase D-like domain-containing protein n=1 Tax=Pseudomonas coronafaciens TaxID=53409 RepID=UPI0013C30481
MTDASVLNFKAADRLVVDASDTSVSGGATSALELQRLLSLGVSINTVRNLHLKMYLLGEDLVVGSCNLSSNSQKTLIELAFHTRDKVEIRTAEEVFEKLVGEGEMVDTEFVERILRLPVDPPPLYTTSDIEPPRF